MPPAIALVGGVAATAAATSGTLAISIGVGSLTVGPLGGAMVRMTAASFLSPEPRP